MENVQGRKEELQEVLDRLVQLDPNNRDNLVEIAGLKARQAELTSQADVEQATMERILAQEEKVTTLTLPYDFNDILSDEDYKNAQGQPHKITVANDMIIEVVQEFQRQSYEDHNTNIDQINAGWKVRLDELTDEWATAKTQLQTQNSELQTALDAKNEQSQNDAIDIADLTQQIAQLQLDKQDAEAKRDAAVRDKEATEELLAEKQAHIDTLRDEIAIGASKAINVTNINPSDRLAALVEQSKIAKIKSARELALESDDPFRGKIILVDGTVVAPPLSVGEATFQPNQASDTVNDMDQAEPISIPADHQEVTFPTDFPVQSGHDMAETNSPVEMAGATIEEAFRRIEQLELTVYGQKAEVA